MPATCRRIGERLQIHLSRIHLFRRPCVDRHFAEREFVEHRHPRGQLVRRVITEPDLDRKTAGHRVASRLQHPAECIGIARKPRPPSLLRDHRPGTSRVEVGTCVTERFEGTEQDTQFGGILSQRLRDKRDALFFFRRNIFQKTRFHPFPRKGGDERRHGRVGHPEMRRHRVTPDTFRNAVHRRDVKEGLAGGLVPLRRNRNILFTNGAHPRYTVASTEMGAPLRPKHSSGRTSKR